MIGVVLMLGITVTLILVVAPVIFMMSGDAGETEPSVGFAFSYSEDVDENREDTFGNTREDVDGTGLVTIVFDDGEPIGTDQLAIAGSASDGSLSESVDYGNSKEIIPGETITVWAQRSEDVRLLWTSEDGEQSATLSTYPIRPGGDLPVFVPGPDEDCGWVDQRTPGDLTVDEIVVQCDLGEYDIDNIDIQNGGAIIGDVTASEEITLDDGATYLGTVEAGNDLDVQNGATVGGDVIVNGSLDVAGSAIEGDAAVEETIDVDGGQVRGELDGSDTVTLDNSIVEGDLAADGEVDSDGSVVSGTVSSETEITLDNESEIRDGVSLDDVASDLNCADGDSSTIGGVGCEEYKSPEYVVTIEETTEPVEGEDDLEATVTVENIGFESGEQDIVLEIDGEEKDRVEDFSVDGQESEETTLTWETESGDNGTYEALVESEDSNDTADVTVASEDRELDELVFEIDDEPDTVSIHLEETVSYTAVAEYDDGSDDDVTDEVSVEIVEGDNEHTVDIDELDNEITGNESDTATVNATYDENGDIESDTVEVTVREPMADRITLDSSNSDGQTVEFELRNTGGNDVEIASIIANSTSHDQVDQFDNDGSAELTGGGSSVDTQSIEIDGDTRRSFSGVATVADGETEPFELRESRQHNGNDWEMDGEHVTFTLYFSDETSKKFGEVGDD